MQKLHPKRFWSLEFRSGFTLLEMIISIGVFSVLVIASIGITLGVSNAQIKAQNIQFVLDNIRFSLELITKEMRTGTNYALTTNCAPLGSEISFITSTGQERVYFLDAGEGIIWRARAPITNEDCENPSKVSPFTSEQVMVERLNFTELYGQVPGGTDGQPRITITLTVISRSPKLQLQSSMNLQTTIVQRLRDL